MFYLTIMHSTHFIYSNIASTYGQEKFIIVSSRKKEGHLYLMMHSTHFIYSKMASDIIWLRTTDN